MEPTLYLAGWFPPQKDLYLLGEGLGREVDWWSESQLSSPAAEQPASWKCPLGETVKSRETADKTSACGKQYND